MRPSSAIVVVTGVLFCVPVRADAWVVAEAPAAMAISEAQEGVFRPGAMPALGGYLDFGYLAVGLRLRAGVLRDGPQPGGNLEDPQLGGLATGAMALRGLWRGGWAEIAGGGGVTGHDLVPAVELGVGWHLGVGGVDVGPSVRYLRVVAGGGMETFGTAELALIGLDVRFGKARPARARPAPVATPQRAAPRAPEPEPAPEEEIEEVALAPRDEDPLLDRDVSCAQAMEGCLDLREVTVLDDRLILDERVLFDLGRARIHSKGRRVVRQIAALWQQHPEWRRMRVEGHSCDLGDAADNLELSRRRAEQVRRVLLRRGIAPELVDAVGVGQARPLDPGTSAAARQRNRRVEFVIERGGAADQPGAQAAPRPAPGDRGARAEPGHRHRRGAPSRRRAHPQPEPQPEPQIELEDSR